MDACCGHINCLQPLTTEVDYFVTLNPFRPIDERDVVRRIGYTHPMFDRAAMSAGAIPRKYKELIAIAVALTTQCPYSLEVHQTNATNAGATDAELAEEIFIAAATTIARFTPSPGAGRGSSGGKVIAST